MKITKLILLSSALLSLLACSKNGSEPMGPQEEAWTKDESLRVPIRFSSSTFTQVTKTMVNEWSDMDEKLGVLALNLGGEEGLAIGSYDIYLDNEPASCVSDPDTGKDMIEFEENKYYPYSSDRNLSFVSYYPYFDSNELEYYADSIVVPIPKSEWGKHDIMYASAFAERMYVKYDGTSYVPAEKDVDATNYYDGFNATYMRYLYKNGLYDSKMPHLHFSHKTTCLMFEAFLKEDQMSGVAAPVIQSIEITGLEIYDQASLVVARTDVDAEWTGELVVSGTQSSTLKIGGQDAEDLNAMPDAEGKYTLPDYQFFLQPMPTSSDLNLKITLENPVNGERMQFTAAVPKVTEIDEFKAGHYYPFKIIVNHFTGIEISASVEAWQPGWADGGDRDAIGDDTPTGSL